MATADAQGNDDVALFLADATLLRGLSELRWHLDDLLADRSPVLVVDISGLSRLSSATLAALLWAQRGCRGRGGRVVLRGPTKRCRDVLVRTGLVDLFAVEDADAAPLSGRAVLAGRGS
jgi:anti-anti-sigma factor